MGRITASRKQLKPDPVYGSILAAKFINCLMYSGKKSTAPVLFLGHLDVVEARREDWSTDPFQLIEKDGWFYGRGTEDMKDGDAALLETLIRLKREHFVPAREPLIAVSAKNILK